MPFEVADDLPTVDRLVVEAAAREAAPPPVAGLRLGGAGGARTLVVTPAPGRTAPLPCWGGEGSGPDYGFRRTIAGFTGEIAAWLDMRRTQGRWSGESSAVLT